MMDVQSAGATRARKCLIAFAVAAVAVVMTASIFGFPFFPLRTIGGKAEAAGSNCPSPTVSNIPCIKYGWKDGPVLLTPSLTTIASLPVGPGKYEINAKLYVQNYLTFSKDAMNSACQLVAGPNFDWAKESLPQTWSTTTGNSEVLQGTMSLTVQNTFTTAGTIDLKCSGDSASPGQYGITANFIKITAERTGTAIRVNMP